MVKKIKESRKNYEGDWENEYRVHYAILFDGDSRPTVFDEPFEDFYDALAFANSEPNAISIDWYRADGYDEYGNIQYEYVGEIWTKEYGEEKGWRVW